MSSTTRVKLVICPECRTLLLPAYRCAHCDAILEGRETVRKKSSKDSETGPPSSRRDRSSSSRKGTYFSSTASVSGSEQGFEEIEFEGADPDNTNSRESAFSSSRHEYDTVSCRSFGEPTELGRDSDGVYEGEDTLSEISALEEEDEWPSSVSKGLNLRWSTNSQKDNLGRYQKPQYGVSSCTKFVARKRDGSLAPATKTQCSSNESALPSTGNEYTKLDGGQGPPVSSRRTFNRINQLPSQKREVDFPRGPIMDDSWMPRPRETPGKAAICSETIINQEKMASSREKFGERRSPPMMRLPIKQNQSENSQGRVIPICAEASMHEDFKQRFDRRAPGRHDSPKFDSAVPPPSSVDLHSAGINPPRRTVHTIESSREGSPLPLEDDEREVVLRRIEELKVYLTKSPPGDSVTQSDDAFSGTYSSQSGSSRSMNEMNHTSCNPDEDCVEPIEGRPSIRCARRIVPEPSDSSQMSNLQHPRNHRSLFAFHDRRNFESNHETVRGPSVQSSLPFYHCSDNSNPSMPLENEVDKFAKFPVCHPLLGGAPFLVCFNCSEYLRLPSKGRFNKVRCGNCNEILTFDVSHKRRIGTRKQNILTDEEQTKSEDTRSKALSTCGERFPNREAISVISNDLHSERISFSEEYSLSFPRSDCSSSSGSYSQRDPSASLRVNPSEETNSLTNRREECPKRSWASPFTPTSGSPLRSEMHNFSESEFLERNQSGHSQSENGGVDKELQMHEVEYMSRTDYVKGNSSESAKWGDQGEKPQNSSKGSHISGFVRKGVANIGFNSMRRGVSVNGKRIPDMLVKKAEERAGHIDPGHYWYDYHAGFWGVMGKPCSGIIPPHIEEFNIPMSKDCAGGRTGVTFNGRELHHEDFEILVEKGLPTCENREYLISISGQVVDTATHRRFDLGNLAPTKNILWLASSTEISKPLLSYGTEDRTWVRNAGSKIFRLKKDRVRFRYHQVYNMFVPSETSTLLCGHSTSIVSVRRPIL